MSSLSQLEQMLKDTEEEYNEARRLAKPHSVLMSLYVRMMYIQVEIQKEMVYQNILNTGFTSEPPDRKVELLLSLKSSIAHTPGLMTSSVSVESLYYQIGKDSAWQCSSLTRSPVPIKLWGKDFINIQTILPCSALINGVEIGFRLRNLVRSAQGGVYLQQYEDLEIRGAGSFYMWESQ